MNAPARKSTRRRWPLAAGFSCVVLVSGGVAMRSLQAQQENAAADDRSTALVEKQRQLSARALELIAKSIDLGAPVFASSQDTIEWSRELLGCRIYLSLDKGEPKTQDPEVYLSQAKGPPHPARVAAFEDHHRRAKVVEERYLPLYQKGDLSAFNYARIESARLQAEIWLSREKNRR